jgi:hypothetical protein
MIQKKYVCDLCGCEIDPNATNAGFRLNFTTTKNGERYEFVGMTVYHASEKIICAGCVRMVTRFHRTVFGEIETRKVTGLS